MRLNTKKVNFKYVYMSYKDCFKCWFAVKYDFVISRYYFRIQIKLASYAIEHNKRNYEDTKGCVAFIIACVNLGVRSRDDIVRTVVRHSYFNHRQVGAILSSQTGKNKCWVRDATGNYVINKVTHTAISQRNIP